MKKILVAAAAVLMASGSANAAQIINGSFENGVNPGSFTAIGAGSGNITGWTIEGAGVDYIGSYWQAAEGVRSVDLSNLTAGAVSQILNTVVGGVYTVNFSLAGNPDGGSGAKIAITSAGGALPQIDQFTVVAGTNTRANMGWQNYSYTFTAFDTQSKLTFAAVESTPFGPALDNISITGVPEPTTWAMMIGGFGLVGGAMRRRSQIKVALA